MKLIVPTNCEYLGEKKEKHWIVSRITNQVYFGLGRGVIDWEPYGFRTDEELEEVIRELAKFSRFGT